jgi:hypothetical protein
MESNFFKKNNKKKTTNKNIKNQKEKFGNTNTNSKGMGKSMSVRKTGRGR